MDDPLPSWRIGVARELRKRRAGFRVVAAVLLVLESPRLRRWTPLLTAIGPLLKATALPICVFAVAVLWTSGRRREAAWSALASLLFFPVQFLRGWKWGATYELNRVLPPISEGISRSAVGFTRSVYTFAKTTFWLGNGSFFRAPLPLVLGFFPLLVLGAASMRLRPEPRRRIAHLVAASTAAAGFVIFAIANRRFFGDWGGVGGWYVWSWFPWLAVAVHDLVELRPGHRRPLAIAIAAFTVAANVLYYAAAMRLYR